MQKQHKNLISTAIFFISLLLMSLTSFANTAADELAQLLSNFHTMQAAFEQSFVNQHGKSIGTKTTGKMILARPGKFRWETMQPNKQLIIINKEMMFLYDPDLAQLIKRKITHYQPGNPALFLSNPLDSLKQSFQIVKLKKQDRNLRFKLTPKMQKHQENGYQWLEICFVDNKLSAMYIFDNLEQTTLIRFANAVFNADIPSTRFTFNPPPHTEIFNEK